eukprot:424250-Rhodomonas_salina.1
MTRADTVAAAFLAHHDWAREERVDRQFSWEAAKGGCMADLDHIVAFPSVVQSSPRRLLPKIDPLHDHHPIA